MAGISLGAYWSSMVTAVMSAVVTTVVTAVVTAVVSAVVFVMMFTVVLFRVVSAEVLVAMAAFMMDFIARRHKEWARGEAPEAGQAANSEQGP